MPSDTELSFELALAQIRVLPGDRHANFARAVQAIEEAARHGADIVLLPEALPVGWLDGATRAAADAIPDGPMCLAFRDAARHAGIYVCTGLVERDGDRIYNAAVLIDDRGKVLLHHRKIHELPFAHDLYARGDRLGVARTPWGVVGLMICADGFAEGQVISRTLALMGARVILSPCAWAVPPDHDNARDPYGALWLNAYGAAARDGHLWIAGASNVGVIGPGPWHGHHCIGCSLVVGPSGAPVAQGSYGRDAEVMLYVRVTPQARPPGR